MESRSVMDDGVAEHKAPLSTEEIAAAARAVGGQPDLAAKGKSLLAAVQSWASPSLVLGLQKDAAASAWRVIPELATGPAPAGLDKFLSKLEAESPSGSLLRPTLVRPGDDFVTAHVKLHDSWIVPWTAGAASGFLLLRGIPRPYPSNLGDAVALASQPVWPALGAAPAATPGTTPPAAQGPAASANRLENLLDRARGAAEDLLARIRDERERLRSAAPGAEEAPRSEEVAVLRGRLESAEVQVREGGRHLTELKAKAEAIERARAAAEKQCEGAELEAAGLRDQVEALERKAEEAARQVAALRERAEEIEKARAAAEAERARARSEANHLWNSVESFQRELKAEKERFDGDKTALEEGRKAAERALEESGALLAVAEKQREEARAAAAAAEERATAAAERARLLEERWEKSVGAFRAAFEALRRTPFVPPALRVSLGGAEGYLADERSVPVSQPGSKTQRVLLLDRDASGLDALAGELEAAGTDVLIAHYPEEVAFFLKTPDSRGLTALVCDVMAFRPDQDLWALFRTWRLEQPDLGLLLSFKSDNETEADRAQRVPVVLTAGYLQRPLQKDAILEALSSLRRRHAGRA